MDVANIYKLTSAAAFAKLHYDDTKDKHIVIPDDFPVATGVSYEMSEWQLKDLLNERHATVNDSKTRIEWHKYALPHSIIDDLKRLALLCLFTSMCASSGSTHKKAQKPNTVTTKINSLAKFFTKIYQHSILMKSGNKEVTTIKRLPDISYKMMREVAADYPENGNNILIGLRQLGKLEVRRFLNSDVDEYSWNERDVDNINFKKLSNPMASKDKWEEKTLPNTLFRFITKEAVEDVATMIVALDSELHDKSALSLVNQDVIDKFSNTQAMLSDYIEIRRLDTEGNEKNNDGGKVQTNGSTHTSQTGRERKEFKERYGVSVQNFMGWWTVVRTSAQILILQYIGFRHSESFSLKFNHAQPKGKTLIKKSGNVWIICGTEIKRKDSTLPVGKDEWVAIPIVRDAISVLEKLNGILNKSYVFSSSQLRGKSKDRGKTHDRSSIDTPYSPVGFTKALNQWKKKKDVNSEWEHWHLNVKQFRHSVANQLARAGLGLEFITYQMKHMVQTLSDMPSDVTLGYGGVGEMMQENALRSAKEEAVRNLYHPGNPVAGGMAEEFKESRLAYFKGAMASGITENEYFTMLAEQGIPFINVGGGYCSGRKYVQYSDGSKSQAACIGSYECSPHKCSNSIVTQSHVPVWIDMYKSNKKNADDPELFYAREAFIEKANNAKEVLELLNVDTKVL